MKAYKITYLLAFLLVLTGCDMFKMDNYDRPNAKIRGSIIDAATKELVGTESSSTNGSTIKVYEKGYTSETLQTWVIKSSGEYQNDLVFASHYRVEFTDCNFFPFTVDDVELKPGANVRDFEVTPYIRVKNPSITRQGDKVVATFNLEAGKPEVKLSQIRLFSFSDWHVGQQVTFVVQDPEGAEFPNTRNFNPSITIDSSTQYTLTIDIPHNATDYFKYAGKNYYFRIGALADVSGVGTVRHNFSQTVAFPVR